MRRIVSSSLSIVFLAHNCELTLTADILDLLDIVSDLSDFVEVLIIDDGSIDETRSVAQDLARRFPQVYTYHNAMRYGVAAALQTAMRETTGDYVFFCTEIPSFSQLRRLWSLRKSPRFVMGQPSEDQAGGTLRLIHRPSVVSQAYIRSDAAERRTGGPTELRTHTVTAPEHAAHLTDRRRRV
jgi:hypothetical protein